MPHLLWHGASLYKNHEDRDTHTYCRAFGSGAVTTCFCVQGLSWQGIEHLPSACRANALTHCAPAAAWLLFAKDRELLNNFTSVVYLVFIMTWQHLNVILETSLWSSWYCYNIFAHNDLHFYNFSLIQSFVLFMFMSLYFALFRAWWRKTFITWHTLDMWIYSQ